MKARASALSVVSALMLLAGSGLALAPEARALPEVDRLFGCPLDAPADQWVPRKGWTRTTLAELGIRLETPGAWALDESPSRASLESASGKTRIRITQSRLPADKLDTVKRATEQRELGPSHAGPACAEAVARHLAEATGFERVRVGVYGRPLGARQRSYAVYAVHRGAVLTVILTIKWGRRASGPDLEVVRRVLGGVRATRG